MSPPAGAVADSTTVAEAIARRLDRAKTEEARDLVRLSIARARVVGGGRDCRADGKNVVHCTGPERSEQAVLARYRADFEGRSRTVALETYFGRCFAARREGAVEAKVGEPLCVLLASELAGAEAPGATELERGEVAALMREAAAAFAGKPSRMSSDPRAADEKAQAERLAKVRDISARWRREMDEYAEIVGAVRGWEARPHRTEWSARDEDRQTCQTRIPQAFMALLQAPRGIRFSELRERAGKSAVLSLLLDAHSMCHGAGAFRDGHPTTVMAKAFYDRSRYEWARASVSPNPPNPFELAGTLATVAKVKSLDEGALVSFVPIEQVREQFSNCVETNKIAGYVRNGRDLDVRYEQRCQVRNVKRIFALAPIIVDRTTAAALASGTIVSLDRVLANAEVASASQPSPLPAVDAVVEWAFANGPETRSGKFDDAKVVVALHAALSPKSANPD